MIKRPEVIHIFSQNKLALSKAFKVIFGFISLIFFAFVSMAITVYSNVLIL